MNDCTSCGGRILEADGELVCGSCGIVAGRSAEMPDSPLSPDTRLDFGLASVISRANRDYAGKMISLSAMAERLRMCNQRTQKNNRTLPAAMAQISRLRDALGMTDAAGEYAAYIYRKAVASEFLTGRVVRHCTAAAVLLACRKHGMSRTMADVMAATNVKRRDIYRTYRQLCDRLELKIPIPDPVSYITRIAEAAGVNEATRREALEILSSVDRSEIAGKDPMGLAASVLYLSCVRRGEVVYRRNIASAAGVAETTLSNRYNSLLAAVKSGNHTQEP